MNKQGKAKPMTWLVGILVVLGIVIALPIAWNQWLGADITKGTAVTGGTPVTGATSTSGQVSLLCPTTPTMTFNAKDVYSNTIVATTGSTAYYKTDGLSVTTSAPTIKDKESYKFWISNASTYYVTPKTFTGQCADNQIQTFAYSNVSSAPTFSLIDEFDGQPISATNNVSNTGTPKVTLKYSGVAFKSAMPFGGILAVDYNKTITSVVCSSNDVDFVPQTFHINSHAASSLSYTTKYIQIGSTIDQATGKITRGIDDGTGNAKSLSCQFLTNGNAVGANSQVTYTFYPANHYITDSGDIALDTETNLVASATNTLSGKGTSSASFYWSG